MAAHGPNDVAPMSEMPDTWTVKEVVADLKSDLVGHLNRQDDALVKIASSIDNKADKSDVVALGVKIDGHGSRIASLEEHRTEVESSKRFRNRAWAAVGTVAGIAAIIIGSLIGAHFH